MELGLQVRQAGVTQVLVLGENYLFPMAAAQPPK